MRGKLAAAMFIALIADAVGQGQAVAIDRPSTSPQGRAHVFTIDQARRRIDAGGYARVSGLRKDAEAIWRGKATTRERNPIDVMITSDGDLVTASTLEAESYLWGPEVQVTSDPSDAWYAAIGASGNTVHMARGNGTILYRRSRNEGATWTSAISLGSGFLYLEKPLVADHSYVYIAYFKDIRNFSDWCCDRQAGDIYIRVSQNHGTTWKPEIRLSTARSAYRIAIAAAGSSVHVVWMDFRAGIWDIYYRRSMDSGTTWGPEVRLVRGTSKNGSTVGAERPGIDVSGNSVFVAWMDGRDGEPPCYSMPECSQVYFKRSLDGGNTWEPEVRLTADSTYSARPVVTSVGSRVFVAYDHSQANDGNDAYLLESTDGGASWNSAQRISYTKAADHTTALAEDSSVYLAHMDMRSPGTVSLRISNDSGVSFLPEERVSPGSEVGAPYLGATSRYLHVLWPERRTGTWQWFYRGRLKQ
jgi:BNR repeat-like domain